MISGQPCPRTGAIIGCPDIDRAQLAAYHAMNRPGEEWVAIPRLTLGKMK